MYLGGYSALFDFSIVVDDKRKIRTARKSEYKKLICFLTPLRTTRCFCLPPATKTKRHPVGCLFVLVGEGGFEPPKSLTTDLQSAPFGHSGTLPNIKPTVIVGLFGAGGRTRTPDLLITNQLLYQLSYTSEFLTPDYNIIFCMHLSTVFCKKLFDILIFLFLYCRIICNKYSKPHGEQYPLRCFYVSKNFLWQISQKIVSCLFSECN